MTEAAPLGVIGGSGLYELLSESQDIEVGTPFGSPSASVAMGEISGRKVAFLPRHGRNHEHPAHRVNYRANLWALYSVGVRQVVAPCASGSLRTDFRPGDFVVLDQLFDRTTGRVDTYFDGPTPGHVSLADPYCPHLSRLVHTAAQQSHRPSPGEPAAESSHYATKMRPVRVHVGGTVGVISGPRFSTRVESKWLASVGVDVVNMTQYPEVVLARELGMCYAGLALVTDRDTGDEESEPVTMEAVFEILKGFAGQTRRIVEMVARTAPASSTCGCAALKGPVESLG